jgi:PhnB protein
MQVQPYLNFDGRAEEAIEFYRKAIGAELLMLMRFKECPDAPKGHAITPGTENKVMHSCLRIGDSQVMLSDGYCQGKTSFQGVSLSLSVANEAEADRKFAALADGGNVQLPLSKTFFSPRFGMVADRFGVSWMVIVPGEVATKAGKS